MGRNRYGKRAGWEDPAAERERDQLLKDDDRRRRDGRRRARAVAERDEFLSLEIAKAELRMRFQEPPPRFQDPGPLPSQERQLLPRIETLPSTDLRGGPEYLGGRPDYVHRVDGRRTRAARPVDRFDAWTEKELSRKEKRAPPDAPAQGAAPLLHAAVARFRADFRSSFRSDPVRPSAPLFISSSEDSDEDQSAPYAGAFSKSPLPLRLFAMRGSTLAKTLWSSLKVPSTAPAWKGGIAPSPAAYLDRACVNAYGGGGAILASLQP